MKTFILSAFLISFLSVPAMAALSKSVEVRDSSTSFRGTLMLPNKAKGDLPLVVVVPEWWGKNDYADMRGKKFADEFGVAALVVDLYGEGKTATDPKKATELSGPFYQDPSLGVKRLKQFIDAAPAVAKTSKVNLNLNQIVVVGYCFGGSQALNLARDQSLPAGETLVGVISYHAGLASTLKAKGPIPTKLMVLHGADDKMVSEKDVEAFKAEMKTANADLDFKAYPGATHAFTNPKATAIGKKYNIPIAYNEAADKDSWAKTKVFLETVFKK